jgi:hypothetical protein
VSADEAAREEGRTASEESAGGAAAPSGLPQARAVGRVASPARAVVTSAHWDGIYGRSGAERVSWYQAEPAMSLELLEAAGLAADGASVLDVGGGASLLVDRLLEAGVQEVSVLDCSRQGLSLSQQRLGASASKVDWILADLLCWEPSRTWRLWHDRAVLHFFTDDESVARYVELATRAVEAGGAAVIATFAPDGPTSCSGLAVRRWAAVDLAERFGPAWSLEETRIEDHLTPSGSSQRFSWVVLRRFGGKERQHNPG